MKLPLICSLCLAGFSLAAEPVTFPMEVGTLKTVGAGSRTYDGVKVVSKDAVGIKIMHEGGTSRIAYDKLPPELKQRFAVDPEAAKAQLRKEAEQNAAHDRAVEDGLPTPDPEGGKTTAPEMAKPGAAGQADGDSDAAFITRILAEDKPDATGKTKAERIAAMKGYVGRLKKQMSDLDADLKEQEESASKKSAWRSKRANAADVLGGLGAAHEKYQKAQKEMADKLREAERELFDLEFGQ